MDSVLVYTTCSVIMAVEAWQTSLLFLLIIIILLFFFRKFLSSLLELVKSNPLPPLATVGYICIHIAQIDFRQICSVLEFVAAAATVWDLFILLRFYFIVDDNTHTHTHTHTHIRHVLHRLSHGRLLIWPMILRFLELFPITVI